MKVPVASCLVCGKEKELVVWVDPAITGGSFHGVCFQCRQAAQQNGQSDKAVRCQVVGCMHDGKYFLCEDHAKPTTNASR